MNGGAYCKEFILVCVPVSADDADGFLLSIEESLYHPFSEYKYLYLFHSCNQAR